MKNKKNISLSFSTFIVLFFFVLQLITFFSPIALAIYKNNYFLLFLFSVSWIPSQVLGKIGNVTEEIIQKIIDELF